VTTETTRGQHLGVIGNPLRLIVTNPLRSGVERAIIVSMRTGRPTVLATALSLLAFVAVSSGAQEDLISQARRLDLAGKQDAAIALYAQVLQSVPESFDAQYGLARALDLAGRYEEAREHFAKAIDLASESEKDQAIRMMGVSFVLGLERYWLTSAKPSMSGITRSCRITVGLTWFATETASPASGQ